MIASGAPQSESVTRVHASMLLSRIFCILLPLQPLAQLFMAGQASVGPRLCSGLRACGGALRLVGTLRWEVCPHVWCPCGSFSLRAGSWQTRAPWVCQPVLRLHLAWMSPHLVSVWGREAALTPRTHPRHQPPQGSLWHLRGQGTSQGHFGPRATSPPEWRRSHRPELLEPWGPSQHPSPIADLPT